MPHLHPLGRCGRPAMAGIAPEVKLTYIRNVFQAADFGEFLDATIPLFVNKDPDNPLPPDGGGGAS